MLTQAVILAAGAGKRMRQANGQTSLDPAQSRVASSGVKAMIPFERPFLDYVLSSLADAGITRVCLVIGPHHREICDYYTALHPRRVHIDFAVQPEPLGTAHAVLSAEPVVGPSKAPFLVINSDNYYPPTAFAALAALDGPGIAAFDRDALARGGNIAPERILDFAIAEITPDGHLAGILEKPAPADVERLRSAGPIGVSMNCWRFSPAIFDACRAIPKSPRGEYEIPMAVEYSMKHLAQRYRVVMMREAVLDLSTRADIAAVGKHLAGKPVIL